MTLGLHRLHRPYVQRVLEDVGVGHVPVVAAVPVVDPETADLQHPRIVDDRVRCDGPGDDRPRQRDHLHHRSGLVHVARDVVLEEGGVGVGEIVGVVARVVGPRDDAASGGVHDQHAPALGASLLDSIRERLFSRVLNVRVKREDQA